MRNKLPAVILALLGVALSACIFVIYHGQDHEPPVITIEETDLIYEEGCSQELLMEGVSAADDVDGDLTDCIFISDIDKTADGKYVSITYVAVDQAHNVAKETRLVAYHDYGKQNEE